MKKTKKDHRNSQGSSKSCLVHYLFGLSDSEGGFEHPLEFYDEDDRRSVLSSTPTSYSARDGGGDKDYDDAKEQTRRRRRRLGWIALIALLLLILIVIVATMTTRKNRVGTRSSAAKAGGQCSDRRQRRAARAAADAAASAAWTVESVRRLDITQEELDATHQVNIGCFRVQTSPDNRTIVAETYQERVDACEQACFTNYFALAPLDDEDDKRQFDREEDTVTCYCFVEKPLERLSIGPCHRTSNIEDVLYDPCGGEGKNRSPRQEMEVYFDPHWNAGCNQDTSKTVRNFLVEEDDVPFGFDIVTSEFRPSPFELYKDECGTNVFEVQTEVSQGSRKLTTTVNTIQRDAEVRREDLADAVKRSDSYSIAVPGFLPPSFFAHSSTVAGLADERQYNLFASQGAQETGSSVFSSYGVKRLAEVKIADFDNKRDFVTFHPEFGALLRDYLRGGFARSTAQQIFRTYGMFVVTRGIFGGYLEVRTTMLASDVENWFDDREGARQCYESYVSDRGSALGFFGSSSGSSPVETGDCDANALAAFEAARRAYELDTSEADVVGGSAAEGDLLVTPETSSLLTSSDMYPLGDNGLELRPLTDFLSPRVISPLEIKRYQLLESEFAQIQEKLQAHIVDEMSELDQVLKDKCSDCEVPYFVPSRNNWGFSCQCYKPPPPTFVPDPAPPALPLTAIVGTYKVEIRRRGELYWGVGSHNQATLTISLDNGGTVVYDGTTITEYEYDVDRKFLSWDEHLNVPSRAELTFYTVKDDQSFFEDYPEYTGSNVFMGVIDDGWFAADEIRGFREDPEGEN